MPAGASDQQAKEAACQAQHGERPPWSSGSRTSRTELDQSNGFDRAVVARRGLGTARQGWSRHRDSASAEQR